jgi:hypothetical protein
VWGGRAVGTAIAAGLIFATAPNASCKVHTSVMAVILEQVSRWHAAREARILSRPRLA